SYSALVFRGSSRRRSRATSAPSGPAWPSSPSAWSWSSPAARLASRAPQTASAALMPAWMARLVAAMLRPAWRSLVAASANSRALAAYERTCAAETVLVRADLATSGVPEFVEAEPMHDLSVTADVGPHLAPAPELG